MSCGALFLALQARISVHIGGGNLDVGRNVVRILGGLVERWPLPSIKDGDLVLPAKDMRITEVKGHADDEMVRMGVVEQVDKDGNDQADSAADLGRKHVDACVIERRRVFSQACHVWYLIVYDLHSSVPWCGLQALFQRNAKSMELFEMLLGFLGPLTLGLEGGKGGLTLVLLGMIWLFGFLVLGLL